MNVTRENRSIFIDIDNIMRILDLFSGTESVKRTVKKYPQFCDWEVVSLDLAQADICCNILDWDYEKEFSPRDFDVVWASPPCTCFSRLKRCNLGRQCKNGKVFTPESIEDDIQTIGLPLLNRTFEIIDYFQPDHWFVENPATARTKDYIHDKPFYVVDYCQYGMPYRKRTNIWTNLKSFEPLLCDKNCSGWDGKKHAVKVNELGGGSDSTINGKRAVRSKVPEELIRSLFMGVMREKSLNGIRPH